MSKEKNLVYLNEYGAARVSNLRIESMLANGAWCGPAIDRLFKFEKLGLEPEEIENLKKGYEKLKGARQANLVLIETNNDLFREVGKLREENQRQAEMIDGYAEVNGQLKQKVANFEQTIKERDEEIASLENDYHQVEDACDRLKKENDELKRSQMYSWKDIAEGTQITVDQLRKENKQLQEKNDNQCWNIQRYQKENEELRRQLKNLKESLAILSK